MNIKGVDFPPALLDALRDGRLVVFAGAGVSMGAPARLPSLCKLAERLDNRKRRVWGGPRQPENVRAPWPDG